MNNREKGQGISKTPSLFCFCVINVVHQISYFHSCYPLIFFAKVFSTRTYPAEDVSKAAVVLVFS